MPTFQAKCPTCKKAVSPEMKAAMQERKCPYCAGAIPAEMFQALVGAVDFEAILRAGDVGLLPSQRVKAILAILKSYGLPELEATLNDEEKKEEAPPLPADGLGATLGVGRTHGRDGSKALVMDLHTAHRERAKRMTDSSITFGGDRVPQVAKDIPTGSVGGAARKLGDIPDPVTPDREFLAESGSRGGLTPLDVGGEKE